MLMNMKMGCPLSVMCMIMSCYFLWCSLLLSHCHGTVKADDRLKSFEDFEIEHQLKLINKPAVKIIKSIDGKRYGCVDFYKQPGLDHSSMKNHTFHYKMRLISYPEGLKMKRETINNKTFGHLWENGVGCPSSTVPILRVTKDDLLKWKSFDGDNSKPRSSWDNSYKSLSPQVDTHHFGVGRTKGKPKNYNGASMTLNINIPGVGPKQFSSTRMHFQIGNEFMQVGYTIHPSLYHDNRPRLFVYTNAGGHSCYNNFCPTGSGMILVNTDFTPGLDLDTGVQRIDYSFAITKDKASGNWWLLMAPINSPWEEIGFWPASRFKERFGTKVEWGGEVYSTTLPSPGMGNGDFPERTPVQDSDVTLIRILDENYVTDKKVSNTEGFADNSHCYKAFDVKDSWFKHVDHFVLYGGPGCK